MATGTSSEKKELQQPKDPQWLHRPTTNTLIISLREDVPSSSILDAVKCVCIDHNLTVVERNDAAGLLIAECHAGKLSMAVTFRTGRHAFKGNLLAVEYDRRQGEKIKTIAAITGAVLIGVLVLVAVVAVASAAGDNHSSGGGGGGGGHTSNFFCIADDFSFCNGSSSSWSSGSGSSRRIVAPPRNAIDSSALANYQPIPGTSRTKPADLRPAQVYDKRSHFFGAFFGNLGRFIYHSGIARTAVAAAVVPPGAIVATTTTTTTPTDASSVSATTTAAAVPSFPSSSSNFLDLKSIPLPAGSALRLRELGIFSSAVLRVEVPEHAVASGRALYIELATDGRARLSARHLRVPSWYSTNTLHGRPVGNWALALTVPSDRLQAGTWYLTVQNANTTDSLQCTISASLCDPHMTLDKMKLTTTTTATSTTNRGGGVSGSGKSANIEAAGAAAIATTTAAAAATATAATAATVFGTASTRAVFGAGAEVSCGEDEWQMVGSEIAPTTLTSTTALAPKHVSGDKSRTRNLMLESIVSIAAPPPVEKIADADATATIASAPPLVSVAPTAETSVPTTTTQQQQRLYPLLPVHSASAPREFECCITCELMEDPVVAADGCTYERTALLRWLREHNTSPMTGLPLENNTLVPDIAMRTRIAEWCAQNPNNQAVL